VQKDKRTANGKRRNAENRAAGLVLNRASKESIAWVGAEPNLIWLARISVAFSYAASKNHIYAMRRSGHVALRKESRAMRDEITLLMRSAIGKHRVAHNKVWLDILVQKPNHRGDAINVVDLVCDGLKECMPVDDRWFCIRRLDWQIVKDDPRLYIGVGQDTDEDAQVCSYCGQIKPLSAFNRAKGRPLGVGRECKECRALGRQLGKKAR
jgi:hypothetical protein